MRYATGILTMVLPAAMARGQAVEPKAVGPAIVPVVPDPMALVPADQQHLFGPVDPNWVKKRQWLETSGSGSYRLVDADPHEPGILWEDRYFEPGAPNTQDTFRKLLRYSPDGKLLAEIDRDGTKQWDRRFGANQAILEYTYYVAYGVNGLTAAFSIRQDGKFMSILRNGTGDFIRWKAEGDGFDRFICHEGRVLVEESYSGGKCDAVILYAKGMNSFRHDTGKETLFFSTRAEAWGLVVNGPSSYATSQRLSSPTPDGRFMPTQPTVAPDEISSHIQRGRRSGTRPGGPPSAEEVRAREAQVALKKVDYLARRAEFFAGFSGEIHAAGYTWETLGLAQLFVDPAAELPAPQPEWQTPPASTRPAGQ